MASIKYTEFIFEDLSIPVKIYTEIRNNARVSFGKKAINIRLPFLMSSKNKDIQIQAFYNWARELLAKDDRIRSRFIAKQYYHDQAYTVGLQDYILKFSYKDRKSLGAKIDNQNIHLSLPVSYKDKNIRDGIPSLLSKIVSQHQLPKVKNRIQYLNKHFFSADIKSIKLKHNTSNWGSCSSKGNINISSRLLFAPPDVQDYVYIHELAHFFEMNHSPKFWQLVYDIMPDYKEKEKWLKLNSNKCNF